MKNNKGKFGILFIGVFIGLIAGLIIAVLLDHFGYGIDFMTKFQIESNKNNFSNSNPKLFREIKKETAELLSKKNNPNIDQFNISNDSTDLSLKEFLKLHHDEYPDSFLLATYSIRQKNKNESITVAIDELMYTKQISISGYVSDDNSLDSILLDDRYSEKKQDFASIEFWKSPLNYKGYKWANQKLILFGFYQFDNIKIKTINKLYYLQYENAYYLLEQSVSFHTIINITDEQLIKKLNEL